jgi:hypothetical protein
VPLNTQDVPVTINGRVVAYKTAYFGEVFVGSPVPQNFTVVFDTGSGHFFLPSTACQDESCAHHNRYDPSASMSAVDINHDGVQVTVHDDARDQVSIAYGTGEIVGEFVKETVCLGFNSNASGEHCARVRVITAREMTAEPFKNFIFDGVLGLGLPGLALDPEFHFLGQMTKSVTSFVPVFGVFLSSRGPSVGRERSEITLGGHDRTRTQNPLDWVHVHQPESGHWRIRIRGIRIGDQRVPFCDDGGCTTILDTGTSMLGVPRASLQDFLWRTAREVPQLQDGEAVDPNSVDCRKVAGPAFVFELDNGLEVSLDAEDYTRPAPSKIVADGKQRHICRSSLLPIDMPPIGERVFIWGEPVLRKYYTAYDAREPPHVGFALATHAVSNEAGSEDKGAMI